MQTLPNKKIFFVIPLVLVSLILGMLAGLFRLGWSIPMGQVAGEHGALMVGSFLGTLICLERIVALKKKWLYVIPVLSGSSFIFFLLGKQALAMALLTIGSLGLVYIYIDLIIRFKEYYYYVMMLGALAWAIGNLLIIQNSFYPAAAPWWIAFILLTVFGERLELSKFMPQSKTKRASMIAAIAIFMTGIILPYHSAGKILAGAGMILMAAWLLHYDIARKSAKATGIHRFTGTLLLAGYFWLALSGLFMIFEFNILYQYDAMLHSFFLGFTFSMIFAHAPIIFPGVAGLAMRPYHKSLVYWGILLQVGIACRILADVTMHTDGRQFAGLLNALVILGFFVNLVIIIIGKFRK